MEKENTVQLTLDEIRELSHEAAREGASQALRELGLQDFKPADFHEMRSLLDAWTDVKKTVWKGFLHIGTVVVLATVAFIVTGKLHN